MLDKKVDNGKLSIDKNHELTDKLNEWYEQAKIKDRMLKASQTAKKSKK